MCVVAFFLSLLTLHTHSLLSSPLFFSTSPSFLPCILAPDVGPGKAQITAVHPFDWVGGFVMGKGRCYIHRCSPSASPGCVWRVCVEEPPPFF
ncbi:MAG: hypothetical protein J3Q66DRAFT_361824 [Benniella sp.]|nr:MAG: hypothetical protein J3Q66DRAFT_361824 [Benniella sp.]